MSTYSHASRMRVCTNIAIDGLSLSMDKLLMSEGFFWRVNAVSALALPEGTRVATVKLNRRGATGCHAKIRAFLYRRYVARNFFDG